MVGVLKSFKSVEPVDISSARSVYSRNTASTLSTRVPFPKEICFNFHSWDHPWTANAVCNKMRMTTSKRRCTDRWSKYTQYSQYAALIESILVLLRVLAVPVVAVPVVAVTVTTGRNTASTWQYPQYRSPKYLKYSSIPQAEYSTVVNSEIPRAWYYPQYTISKYVLRVLAVSEVFSLGNTFLYSHVLGASVKAFIHR